MSDPGPSTSPAAEWARIEREARRWFTELRSGDLSNERMGEWLGWLSRDARHRTAFDAIEDLWDHAPAAAAGALPTPEALAADDYDGQVSVAEWNRRRSSRTPPAITRARAPVGRWLALAAGVVAIAIGVGWSIQTLRAPPADAVVLETAAAEHRRFDLPDGSHVSVGAKSLVVVRFREHVRSLSLERGEAFFEVAKDKQRPFVVHAGGTDVVAVGTAFNVRRAGERVSVAVSEGVVTVEARADGREGRNARSPSSAAHVRAGERAEIDTSAVRPQVLPIATAQVDAWREGRLQYDDESLRSVVADLSRYTDRQIVIDDPAVAEMRLTGTFLPGSVENWLGALQVALPVRAIERGDGTIELVRRQ